MMGSTARLSYPVVFPPGTSRLDAAATQLWPNVNADRATNMSSKVRVRWLVVAAVLALAQSASVTVQAQFFWNWNQQDQNNRQRSRPQSGGLFDWFGGGQHNSRPSDDDSYRPPRQRQQQPNQHTQQEPSESSRAPAPKKAEAKDEQVGPTTSIVVMGDDMADWLAYGLEDVFSDTPEVRVVRKNKLNSGLLRYDAKGDLDWWHVARDTLAQEKADYVVMMLGTGDRQEIRVKDLAKEADTRAKDQQAKDQAAKDPQAKEEAEKKDGQKATKANDTDENGTPSAQRAKKTAGPAEFRSEEWEKIYSRRIDDTIAALKSKGVPVIWVGLPPLRGARSSGDTAYLNDLYRGRAERAGIKYVDVWDGFVDEAGKYSNYGPDFEGQVRRLRLSDGVFFTKAGAIKLARYVEQELSRLMSNRVPVALPSGPFEATPSESRPTERPLTGPVIPLTGTSKDKDKDSDNLLGSPGSNPTLGDAIATKVLAKGETIAAPPGRADNFAWTNGSQPKSAAPETPIADQPKPEAPVAAQPKAVPSALASAPDDTKQQERKKGSAGKLTQQKPAKNSTPPQVTAPPPPQDDVPRPPLPIGPSGSSFGPRR
jgi:uncharacterized protein